MYIVILSSILFSILDVAFGGTYNLTEFPSPWSNPAFCGNTGSYYICDPDGIIEDEHRSLIDAQLYEMSQESHIYENCECSVCTGAVAIIRNMYLPTDSPSDEKLSAEAEEWSRYLREDSWLYEGCQNFVLFIHTSDTPDWSTWKMYTSIGSVYEPVLTGHCIESINNDEYNTGSFTTDDFGDGIYSILEGYKSVFRGEHDCTDGEGGFKYYYIIAPAGLIVFCMLSNEKKKK